MACDAAMAPIVTGEVNPAVLEDLIRLCVQLDKLRYPGPGGARRPAAPATPTPAAGRPRQPAAGAGGAGPPRWTPRGRGRRSSRR